MSLNSRNWKAVQSSVDFAGSKHVLAIAGEVEVQRTNEIPTLAEAVPQGIADEALLMDVQIAMSGDVGADLMVWKEVSYTREVKPGQFRQVTISGVVETQTVDVERIVS
jgi:hypothetical protein